MKKSMSLFAAILLLISITAIAACKSVSPTVTGKTALLTDEESSVQADERIEQNDFANVSVTGSGTTASMSETVQPTTKSALQSSTTKTTTTRTEAKKTTGTVKASTTKAPTTQSSTKSTQPTTTTSYLWDVEPTGDSTDETTKAYTMETDPEGPCPEPTLPTEAPGTPGAWVTESEFKAALSNLVSYGNSHGMAYDSDLKADNCGTYGTDTEFYSQAYNTRRGFEFAMMECLASYKADGYVCFGYRYSSKDNGQYFVRLYIG